MTTTLEKALEAAKALPVSRQEQIGQWVRDIVEQDQSDAQLTPEQNAEVHRRVHESPEAPLSDEETEAFFSKLA